jgi:hypothetical protein
LAIAWIASGENAQITSVIQIRRGNFCIELILASRLHGRRQRQSGEQWPLARVSMDLELAGCTDLGA